MAERIGLFADVSNLYYCCGKKYGRKVDYWKLKGLALGSENGSEIFRAYAYGSQLGTEASKFLECLRNFGYIPRYKRPKEFENPEYKIRVEAINEIINLVGRQNFDETLLKEAEETLTQIKKILRTKKDTRKADWDVGIAIDVVRVIDKIDTVVLGSADGDLAPLLEWVREQGCKTVVLACNISYELRDVADISIEIDDSVFEGENHAR